MENTSLQKNIVLDINNLTYVYGESTPFRHVALDDVSLSVYEGELLGIIGHTGSGKSTLMQHMNGLLKPTSGTIAYRGQNIHESKKITHEIRFKVGLVMQYPEYQLFEESVLKDVAFGPMNRGLSQSETDALVSESLNAVGIGPELYNTSPFELSGGQKRRVAIAGVLAMDPDVLILDEPTAGLDPAGRRDILSLVTTLHRQKGKTVILVSHSMDIIANVADRIAVLNHAKIVMNASPEEVFSRAEELSSMGLDVPELTRLFLELRKYGLPLDTPVYTMDYAVRKLCQLRDEHAVLRNT